MKDLLLRYADALIPLAVGFLALLFPQSLTKLDLAKPENAATARKLKWAGWALVAAGTLLAIASALWSK